MVTKLFDYFEPDSICGRGDRVWALYQDTKGAHCAAQDLGALNSPDGIVLKMVKGKVGQIMTFKNSDDAFKKIYRNVTIVHCSVYILVSSNLH